MKSQPVKPFFFVKKQNNKMLLTICYDALGVMVTQQRRSDGAGFDPINLLILRIPKDGLTKWCKPR